MELTQGQESALQQLISLSEDDRRKVSTWIRFTTSDRAKSALLTLIAVFTPEKKTEELVDTRTPEEREMERGRNRALAREARDRRDLERVMQPVDGLVSLPGLPSSSESAEELECGLSLVEVLVRAGLCDSKSAARRDIDSGSIYLNEVRVVDVARGLSRGDLRSGAILLRRGRKKIYHVVRFV